MILGKLPEPIPEPQLIALPVTRTLTTRLPATAIFLVDFCHFLDLYAGFFLFGDENHVQYSHLETNKDK
jgi:hypothetical protein